MQWPARQMELTLLRTHTLQKHGKKVFCAICTGIFYNDTRIKFLGSTDPVARRLSEGNNMQDFFHAHVNVTVSIIRHISMKYPLLHCLAY